MLQAFKDLFKPKQKPLCIDCKWSEVVELHMRNEFMCSNPKLTPAPYKSIVSGEMIILPPVKKYCTEVRSGVWPDAICGIRARSFEPKFTPIKSKMATS